jgi:hypothetical protein
MTQSISGTQQIESKGNVDSGQKLRHLQEQLLDVTGKEDAARQKLPDSAKGFASQTSYIAVPVYYVTDRARINSREFGADIRGQGMEYGISTTTLGVTYGVRTDLIAGAHN